MTGPLRFPHHPRGPLRSLFVSFVKPTFDPFDWWRDNLTRFPSVGAVARKWLSVPTTSTPSERVFSICGIVDSAKRSSLSGKSIEDQVFIHNNKSLIDV